MKLFTENWLDTSNEEVEIGDPTISDLDDAFASLDGDRHTLLSLELPSGAVLQIGGGPDKYIAQVVNGGHCWLAKGADSRGPPLELAVGGQLSQFEPSAALTCEQCNDIMSVFYHGNGVLTTRISWEVQY